MCPTIPAAQPRQDCEFRVCTPHPFHPFCVHEMSWRTQTRHSHSLSTTSTSACRRGCASMQGKILPHSKPTPSTGPSRAGATRMRILGLPPAAAAACPEGAEGRKKKHMTGIARRFSAVAECAQCPKDTSHGATRVLRSRFRHFPPWGMSRSDRGLGFPREKSPACAGLYFERKTGFELAAAPRVCPRSLIPPAAAAACPEGAEGRS